MIEYKYKYNAQAKDYKVLSLFAGAGGCSFGFSKFGMNIIGAFDIWKEAVATYNRNFDGSKAQVKDLATCDFTVMRDELELKRGELDVLIGGPPCQGFSSLGKQDSKDPRNGLLRNYTSALDIFHPRWFMMENVEGMLTTAKGDFIIETINNMIRLGYTVCMKKVYMQEYGIPQRRKRIIIVGNREGKEFQFPHVVVAASGFRYKGGLYTLYDAIADLESKDIPEINHMRLQETGVKLERIKQLKVGESMKDLPVELQHVSFSRRAQRRVCDGVASEKRGGAPSGIKRLSYEEPCLTITGSSTNEFVHPKEDRMFTLRECARIQTFPDSFVFVGSNSQQEQLIGNAIPPYFANLIAEQIYNYDHQVSKDLPPCLLYYDLTKSTAKSPGLARTCARLSTFTVNLFAYDKTAT